MTEDSVDGRAESNKKLSLKSILNKWNPNKGIGSLLDRDGRFIHTSVEVEMIMKNFHAVFEMKRDHSRMILAWQSTVQAIYDKGH